MLERSIDDYFPRGYPISVNDIEVQNGESIVTYEMMKLLEKRYSQKDEEGRELGPQFYFIMGSDLLSTLYTWDYGEQLINEINFIIFERKGYEKNLDPEYAREQGYPLPKNYVTLKSSQNLIGMISSTEVRRRIKEAREALAQAQERGSSKEEAKEDMDQIKQQIQHDQAILSARYFYQIGGLVTKSTIEFIRERNLYN